MWFDCAVPMIRSPFHSPASRISPRVFDQIAFARLAIEPHLAELAGARMVPPGHDRAGGCREAEMALPRVGGIIAARKSAIDSDLAEAGKLKDESDAALKAYETELANARTKAQAHQHRGLPRRGTR